MGQSRPGTTGGGIGIAFALAVAVGLFLARTITDPAARAGVVGACVAPVEQTLGGVTALACDVGIAMMPNRSATRNSGGNCCSDSWIAMKLAPQMTATDTASST